MVQDKEDDDEEEEGEEPEEENNVEETSDYDREDEGNIIYCQEEG